METGIELIAEERQRQINEEGWDLQHDKMHTNGELSIAAVCYATPTVVYSKQEQYVNKTVFEIVNMEQWHLSVPYHGNKINDNNTLPIDKRIRQLVKAGALIAAEIDRLQNQ